MRIGPRIQIGNRARQEYEGRQVCADTDAHDRAFEQVSRYLQPGQRVADVGCGEGAFALRLVDADYKVVGIDVVPVSEQPTDRFEYIMVDLFNAEARDRFIAGHEGQFDAVVLVEVIEHVHDPWEVLTFARRLLHPDGVLLLSTPNLASFYSRFRFLTSGRFHQFDTSDLEYGHINPMTALMIETVLTETGFTLVEKVRGPAMPVLVWDTAVRSIGWRLFHMLSYLVAAAMVPVMRGGDLDGWSLIFVAQAA
jgi:SAM-dependent methyltransferase